MRSSSTVESGNELALTHGAYVAPYRIAPRAQEIAEQLRPYLPAQNPAFESVLASYSLILVRIERAAEALDEAEATGDAEELHSLYKNLRLWLLASLRYASELGLTPASQARLFRDAGIGRHHSAMAALREHLQIHYGSGTDE